MLNTIAGKQSGLLTDSVIMTDNLTTITTSAIYNVIGSLPTTEIDQALRHTLGI
jgi:mRNA interferase MazF